MKNFLENINAQNTEFQKMSFKFKKKQFINSRPEKEKSLRRFIKKLRQKLNFSMTSKDDIWKVKFIYLFVSYFFQLRRFLVNYTILKKNYFFKHIWLEKFLNKKIKFLTSKQFYYFYYTNFTFSLFFKQNKKKIFYLIKKKISTQQQIQKKKFLFKKSFLSLKIWKNIISPSKIKTAKNKFLPKIRQKFLLNLFLLKLFKNEKKYIFKNKLTKKRWFFKKKRFKKNKKKLLKNVKKN